MFFFPTPFLLQDSCFFGECIWFITNTGKHRESNTMIVFTNHPDQERREFAGSLVFKNEAEDPILMNLRWKFEPSMDKLVSCSRWLHSMISQFDAARTQRRNRSCHKKTAETIGTPLDKFATSMRTTLSSTVLLYKNTDIHLFFDWLLSHRRSTFDVWPYQRSR